MIFGHFINNLVGVFVREGSLLHITVFSYISSFFLEFDISVQRLLSERIPSSFLHKNKERVASDTIISVS